MGFLSREVATQWGEGQTLPLWPAADSSGGASLTTGLAPLLRVRDYPFGQKFCLRAPINTADAGKPSRSGCS